MCATVTFSIAFLTVRYVVIGIRAFLVARVKLTAWLDFFALTALFTILRSCPTMEIGVLSLRRNNRQVFKRVVQPVAVNVVYALIRCKALTEKLFHHVTMLKNMALANGQKPVATFSYVASTACSWLATYGKYPTRVGTTYEIRPPCIKWLLAAQADLQHGISVALEVV